MKIYPDEETKKRIKKLSRKIRKVELEIETMMKEQIEEFSGLIDEEGALIIVGSSLGYRYSDKTNDWYNKGRLL